MNKLFIAPYYQNTYTGILSKIYLDHILSFDHNRNSIVTRAYGGGDQLISEKPISETRTLNGFQSLIQNLSPNQIIISPKFKKNILIPNIIANQLLSSDKYSDKFKLADLILVNNHLDYQKILSLNIAPSKIQQFSLPFSLTPEVRQRKLDLGIFNDFFKFYFIGEYGPNKDTIKSTILAFADTFKNQDCLLVLWLTCTASERSEMLEFYQKTKQSLGIVNQLDNIIFICRPIDYSEISAIHNSCDIYLATNSDYYPFIDEQFAIAFDKHIISREQITVSYSPSVTNTEQGEYIGSIPIDGLGHKMLDKFNNRNVSHKKHKNKPTLYSLI
jgi:hypothetical protein